MTTPRASTHTLTRSYRTSYVTSCPTKTIIASTRGFSFSIVATALWPFTPTSSGHELFPVYFISGNTNLFINRSSNTTMFQKFVHFMWNKTLSRNLKERKKKMVYLENFPFLDDYKKKKKTNENCVYK